MFDTNDINVNANKAFPKRPCHFGRTAATKGFKVLPKIKSKSVTE